jgi:tRNA 2-thiouridine synthesizing protein E
MPMLQNEQTTIEVDDDGYLLRPDERDENVAQALAAREGIKELGPDRMTMLKFIRWYYRTFEFFPIINAICKNVHEPKDYVHEKFINPLIAWKVGGLPHPEEPITSLLEAGQSPG